MWTLNMQCTQVQCSSEKRSRHGVCRRLRVAEVRLHTLRKSVEADTCIRHMCLYASPNKKPC